MSCYLRHVKDILAEAGIGVTPVNKKQIDQAIHEAVDVAYKDCPATWKRLREEIKGDEHKRRALIERLQNTILSDSGI